MNMQTGLGHHHPQGHVAIQPLPIYGAARSMGTPAPVTTTQNNGTTTITDPSNHRRIDVTSNGPGLDVVVYDTSKSPPERTLSSWGDPHDVSKNGITTDSHGARTMTMSDGSVLNLGTTNADGSQPVPGQTGATYNSSVVYIPGNNPNTAAVVNMDGQKQVQASTVTGTIGQIQALKKEPAQGILVGDDGNFHTPDGRILTQELQNAQDVITGGPAALQLAGLTSNSGFLNAQLRGGFSPSNFIFAQIANTCHNGGGNLSFLNFLYQDEHESLRQYKLSLGRTMMDRQFQATLAERHLEREAMKRGSHVFYDEIGRYSGRGWSANSPHIIGMSHIYQA